MTIRLTDSGCVITEDDGQTVDLFALPPEGKRYEIRVNGEALFRSNRVKGERVSALLSCRAMRTEAGIVQVQTIEAFDRHTNRTIKLL